MMSIRLAVFISVLFCIAAPAAATNFYVDAARPDDSGNGTSEATAEKTLSAAIADVAAAGAGTHKIYVKSGTYGGTYYSLGSVASTTNLTIEGYSTTPGDGASANLGTSRPLLQPTDTATCMTRLSSAWNVGTFTLRNLRFAPTSLGNSTAILRSGTSTDNGTDGSWVVQFCDFIITPAYSSRVFDAQTVPATTSTRTFSFTDCTVTGHATAGNLFTVRECGVTTLSDITVTGGGNGTFLTLGTGPTTGVDIQDCSIGTIAGSVVSFSVPTSSSCTSVVLKNNTATSTGGNLITLSGGVNGGTFVVENNDVTCASTPVSLGAPYTNETINNYWRGVVIRGNTLRFSGSGAHAMLLGVNTVNADVSYNTCVASGTAATDGFGIVLKGTYGNIHHNISKGRYAIYCTSAVGCKVTNNTAYATVDPAFCWNINSNPASAGASGTNTADTDGSAVVSVPAADLSKVRVGDTLQITGRTDGIDATANYAITAVDDTLDTITVSPSPGTTENQSWYVYAPIPYDLTVTDNVFDASGSAGVAGYNLAACNLSNMHSRILIDRNVYVAGSDGLTMYAGAAQANLAATKAAWATAPWADSFAHNDDNSVESTPIYASTSTFRISPTADIRPTADRFWNMPGAWGVPWGLVQGVNGVHATRR